MLYFHTYSSMTFFCPYSSPQDGTDGQLLTAEELEGEGITGEEVTVAAYQKHNLPVAINDVGLMLCWEFVSSPKVRMNVGLVNL